MSAKLKTERMQGLNMQDVECRNYENCGEFVTSESTGDFCMGCEEEEFSIDNSQSQLMAITIAINKYYLALDNHEHGGIAASNALSAIQKTLGMSWERGEMQKKLAENPELKLVLN